MTRKFIAPDKHVASVNIEGARTGLNQTVRREGDYFVAADSSQAKALQQEGFIEASLMGSTTNRSLGFICVDCGFGSWFKTCGRCGSDCTKGGTA